MPNSLPILVASLTESSVWFKPDQTRIVWITMLCMCDKNGFVDSTVPGLAMRACVPLESCVQALRDLLSADPDSEINAHDGRRLERVERGWQILSFERYKEASFLDAKKLAKRKYAAKKRAELKNSTTQ
jgi:hypothetical protein